MNLMLGEALGEILHAAETFNDDVVCNTSAGPIAIGQSVGSHEIRCCKCPSPPELPILS